MNGDKVGFLTFADSVIRYRKPQKSRNALWRMLHEIATDESDLARRSSATDVGGALRFLGSVLKRRSVIFVLSDFFAPSFHQELGGLAKRHEVTAVAVRDPADRELPASGYTRLRDPETGKTFLVDCSREKVREAYRSAARDEEKRLRETIARSGVDLLELETQASIARELARYFQSRIAKSRHRLALRLENIHGR